MSCQKVRKLSKWTQEPTWFLLAKDEAIQTSVRVITTRD